jgi:glycine betaine/proline transport system ATP-binding protein
MPKRQLQEVRRNKIGMVFQNVGLLPNRTVIDNITFGLEIQGVSANEREKRGKKALEMVGLNGQAYKRIYELSGGMQQRVGLARALASEQEILLMDEPFSALDPLIRRDMQKLFLDIQGEVQKTVIFVTHDLDEALTLGHRAAVMKDGEIVQLGTAEDILSQPATDYVKLLVQDVNYGKIRLAKDAVVPVETAAYEYESPQVVLRRMRTNHLSTIFVLDSADRLLGLMSIYTVMELIEAHKHDLKGKKMIQPHCVNPDMSLQEMIPLFTDSHSPVVIVDNHHRLQGMISPNTLIANLTERTAVTEQQEVKSYQMEVR